MLEAVEQLAQKHPRGVPKSEDEAEDDFFENPEEDAQRAVA